MLSWRVLQVGVGSDFQCNWNYSDGFYQKNAALPEKGGRWTGRFILRYSLCPGRNQGRTSNEPLAGARQNDGARSVRVDRMADFDGTGIAWRGDNA